MSRDDIPLLPKQSDAGLSLIFATLCIVDIFGVFPIIALPRAIVECGWLGIPLVLVVFGLQIYTAALLGKSWNIATAIDPQIFRKNRYPLVAVTDMTLGRWASNAVSILLDMTVFCGGIPNLLVASTNLQIFGLKVSEMQFNLSFCYWLLVIGILLCPIMWLGSPRDMKSVVTTSTTAVFLTALLVWWSIVTDTRDLNYLPVPISPTWDKFISGYGILAFQFDVHPTVMTVQVDMKKPKDINKAVILSFIVSGGLFAITAGLAVWRYGGSTTANVLQTVAPSLAVQAAVLIAALQLCLSSAIGHSALFQHLEDHFRIHTAFGWKRVAMRSAVVFLGVAVGESVPRFDIVMSLIGSMLTGPLVFILPPLMYSRARELRASVLGLRRASAPEFLCCGPERRAADRDVFSDPRVHSRSTHYGFRDGDEDKNDGYSFVYYEYDNDVELNPYEEDLFDGGANSLRKYGDALELTRSGSLPIMVDASRPTLQRPRRQEVAPNVNRNLPTKFWTVQKLIDWFGYLVVLFGVVITVSSTFINVRNSIRYVKFIPPCIVNATAILPSLI